jgi:hypothetical protein
VQEECNKYALKMKIGFTLLATNAPIVLLKKAGYIDEWWGHSLDASFITWIAITTVATMALVIPWIRCLTDYNRKHKV